MRLLRSFDHFAHHWSKKFIQLFRKFFAQKLSCGFVGNLSGYHLVQYSIDLVVCCCHR